MELVATTNTAATPTKCDIFDSIATITTQMDQIPFNHVGRYLLCLQIILPPTKATSNSYDPFIHVDLPSPSDVAHMSDMTMCNVCAISITDLLASC